MAAETNPHLPMGEVEALERVLKCSATHSAWYDVPGKSEQERAQYRVAVRRTIRRMIHERLE